MRCVNLFYKNRFYHPIRVVEQDNYHVIVVTECSGVQHRDINAVYYVENINVSSVMKLTM